MRGGGCQTLVKGGRPCDEAGQVGVPGEPRTEVSEAVVAEAKCDSVIVDLRPGEKQGSVTHAIPERLRRRVIHRDGYCCAVPGCRHAVWWALHHVVHRNHGGKHLGANVRNMR